MSGQSPVASLLERPGSVEPVAVGEDNGVKSESTYLDLPVDLPMLAPEFPVAQEHRVVRQPSLFGIYENEEATCSDKDHHMAVKRNSHLSEIDISVAIRALSETAIHGHELHHTVDSFERAIDSMFAGGSISRPPRHTVEELFGSIASLHSTTVSLRSATSAIILLARGKPEEKIRAIFDLADTDKDGSLSFKELFEFFHLIFGNVMTSSVLGIMNANGVPLSNPDQLAAATAKECMDMCDLDRNGCLSFEEFRNWFHRPKKNPLNTNSPFHG